MNTEWINCSWNAGGDPGDPACVIEVQHVGDLCEKHAAISTVLDAAYGAADAEQQRTLRGKAMKPKKMIVRIIVEMDSAQVEAWKHEFGVEDVAADVAAYIVTGVQSSAISEFATVRTPLPRPH